MSLDIHIRTITHSEQRYNTIGDWLTPEEGFPDTEIVVSDLGNPDMEFAAAVHELIEMYLAQKRGIPANTVTTFDVCWERDRHLDKELQDCDEPGNDPLAPYYHEHQFASIIERQVIRELGLDWIRYEQVVNKVLEVKNGVQTATSVQT